MDKETIEQFRDMWNEACLSMDIPAISTDTCARIFAVLYIHGNNEYMTHCRAFLQDCEYIQKRFRIMGGETPDTSFTDLVRLYIQELEAYEEAHQDESTTSGIFERHIPGWATKLFKERYGIKLIN